MSLSADQFVDRINLKKIMVRWRSLTLLLLLALILLIPSVNFKTIISFLPIKKEEIIARIYISGVIDEDRERDNIINSIKDDTSIKALIVHINSPGGTLVGGETLYNSLMKVSAAKPVVAVMGNVAASGGYMAAIAANHIIAHTGTITGSIGVLLQSMDFTELSSKVGINVHSLKSGKFKDALSPFAKLTDETRSYLQDLIDNSYDYFISLVAKRRSMSIEEAKSKAEGKIYTGQQALLISLIDQIGGEDEAIDWLKNNNIEGKVEDITFYKKHMFPFMHLFDSSNQQSSSIMAIWNGI